MILSQVLHCLKINIKETEQLLVHCGDDDEETFGPETFCRETFDPEKLIMPLLVLKKNKVRAQVSGLIRQPMVRETRSSK